MSTKPHISKHIVNQRSTIIVHCHAVTHVNRPRNLTYSSAGKEGWGEGGEAICWHVSAKWSEKAFCDYLDVK